MIRVCVQQKQVPAGAYIFMQLAGRKGYGESHLPKDINFKFKLSDSKEN
jgi:hypothetical protein